MCRDRGECHTCANIRCPPGQERRGCCGGGEHGWVCAAAAATPARAHTWPARQRDSCDGGGGGGGTEAVHVAVPAAVLLLAATLARAAWRRHKAGATHDAGQEGQVTVYSVPGLTRRPPGLARARLRPCGRARWPTRRSTTTSSPTRASWTRTSPPSGAVATCPNTRSRTSPAPTTTRGLTGAAGPRPRDAAGPGAWARTTTRRLSRSLPPGTAARSRAPSV